MLDSYAPVKASPLQLLELEAALYYTGAQYWLGNNQHFQLIRRAASHGFTLALMLVAVLGSIQLTRLVTESMPPASRGAVAATGANQAAAPSPSPPATSPAQSARAASLSRSVPSRLQIPSINLDAEITAIGLQPDGSLDVPYYKDAGWYNGSPTPGEIGPSVIDGHVDSIYGLGVFWYLKDLHPGDKIIISRQDGNTVTFITQKLESYNQESFPTQKVYGDISYPGLRLITCHGTFSYASHEYDQNLVVYAKAAL